MYLNNSALSTLMYISGNINTIAGTNPVLDIVGAVRMKTQINQNFWLEASTGAEIVYKLTGVGGVMASGYQTLNSRGYYIYTGAGDALNADSSRNVAINVGSTNTAYKLYVNGAEYATSMTAPVGIFSSVTASTLSVNGSANATSITAPDATFSSITASTLSVNGSANATSITAPVGNFSSLTASTLTINGSANVTTTMTALAGILSSLTASTLTVNGTTSAITDTARAANFSSLTTSTLTAYTTAGFSTLTFSTITGNVISTVTFNATGALTVRRTTSPQATITNGGSGGPALGTAVELSIANNGVLSAIGLQADPRGTYIYANGGDAIRIFSVNRQTNVLGNFCVESAGAYLGFRGASACYRFIDAGTSNSFVRAKYTASGSTDTIVASTTAVLFDSINIPTINAWTPGTYTVGAASGTALATAAAGTLIASQTFTLDSNSWNYQSVYPYYLAFRGGLSMSFSTGTTAVPIRWYGTYQNITQGSGERFMKGGYHFTEGKYVTTNFNMYSISAAVDSEKARIGDNITLRYYAQDYLASGIAVLSTPTQFDAFISPVVV